jgi:glutathionyl-hydroquinone reductase
MISQIIDELKKINRKNYDVEYITPGKIKLHMKLMPEEFKEFVDWLHSNGYINVNGAINRIADYMDYKEDYVIDVFEHLQKRDKIILEYVMVKSKNEFVVLKNIEVE